MEKKRKGLILMSLLDASRNDMRDYAYIPKVVASEMGSDQTYAVKALRNFFGNQFLPKGTGRCRVRVVSYTCLLPDKESA